MSDTDEVPVASGSLAARVQARRTELQAQEPIDLDIPGYEGILIGRYRALAYREQRLLISRHDQVKDVAQREILIAADSLVNACLAICEHQADGNHRVIGRWNPKTAADVFGVDGGDTARKAILAVFGNLDEALVSHFGDLKRAQNGVNATVDEALVGESEASSAAASLSSPPQQL